MTTMPKLRNNATQPKVVRAIHANAGVNAWYYSMLRAGLQEAINDAVLMLTAALPEPLPVGIATDIAQDARPSVNRVERTLKKWSDKWSKKFDTLSKDAAAKFARRSFTTTDTAIKAALKSAGFTVSFKATKRTLESYKLVVADNVGLIRNLQKSLYDKIQQDTWASVRAGGDMAKLSEKLHRSYGIEARRAARIAIDQNNKAKGILEAARRQELGLTQAIWQHSHAGKEPRPTHVAMNGKTYDLAKGMWDEDEGEYVFPGQLINCRCTSRVIVPGFNDGN